MDWWSSQPRPFIIAHRGARTEAPENTLSAFTLAKRQGADGIELDVQLSADGWPVVLHDNTLQRTTNGQGYVSDFPLSHLKTLDAGQSQEIPTLSEVFAKIGADFLYNVELKSTSWRNGALVTAVAACIRAYRLETQVLISSFNPLILQQAKQHMLAATSLAHLGVHAASRLKHNFVRVDADHPYYA